jgi:hypothetical protein
VYGHEREIIELRDEIGRCGGQVDGSEGGAQPAVEFPVHR